MKRIIPQEKRIVPALTNPRPNFTALVKHGANQRPFHTIKRADEAATEEKAMGQKSTKKDAAALKIHRIVFNAAEFPTEDAVKAFLTAKGYADFTITAKDGGGFEVEDNPADAFKGALRSVDHSSAKGVSYIVGDLKDAEAGEDTAKGADEQAPEGGTEKAAEGTEGAGGTLAPEDTAKGKETPAPAQDAQAETEAKAATPRDRKRAGLTVKGVSMNRVVADYEALVDKTDAQADKSVKSFADMLTNYTGGMPPGMYDMGDAFMGELRRMIKSGDVDEKKVATLATDFTRGVLAMNAAYQSIVSATKSAAPGAEPDMAALEAMLDMLFGQPEAKSAPDPHAGALEAITATLTALSEKTDALQKSVDGVGVLMLEQTQVADKGETKTEEPARVIPERKSAEEVAPDPEAAKAEEAATKDEQQRRAKRLGFDYRG